MPLARTTPAPKKNRLFINTMVMRPGQVKIVAFINWPFLKAAFLKPLWADIPQIKMKPFAAVKHFNEPTLSKQLFVI